MNRPLTQLFDPPPDRPRRNWRWLWIGLLSLGAAGLAVTFVSLQVLKRGLPEVATLRNLQLQVPLRVLSADGKLIGEFGAERRALLKFAELPPRLVDAFLAVEDAAFYEHSGVDLWGLARAGLKLVATGDKAQGGSTITMQLARNVFLTPEKTFTRKFREILLAKQIEQELNKQEILELYLNKIYLGERAYGVGAAALAYFGKPVQELGLGEMAVLAALPKAPSRDNPVANLDRATERRNYVLRRMLELEKITQAEYQAAIDQPIQLRPYRSKVEAEAHYAAEMARAEMFARFGEAAYGMGLTVITTLDSAKQAAADRALREALLEYDQRHSWRGPETNFEAQLAEPAALLAGLQSLPVVADLQAAAVLEFKPDAIRFRSVEGEGRISSEGFAWARLGGKKTLKPGDVIRVSASENKSGKRWTLAQLPEVQGALVAVRPQDGAILALAGGYDFWLSKFNHVTQARRQAGSGFKPFLYAAGLAKGYTPASVFLDAPVVFDDPALESSWRPENYDSDFNGPMRLREALVQSRNLVSIRLLQAVGLDAARDYTANFGLPMEQIPRDLTMALGSAALTPLEVARGYAVIANGGFAIEPYLVDEVRDGSGKVLFKAEPKLACPQCVDVSTAPVAESTESGEPVVDSAPAVAEIPPERRAERRLDPAVTWLLTSMLHDVTIRGTAAAVAQLGRNDLAGKTGTTNDETDAWFNGFQKNLVGIAWVGFDQPQPLGRGEVGGRAALPMWMDFMKAALKGVPQSTWPRPPGIVEVRINRETGGLASPGDTSAVFELVQQEQIPQGSGPARSTVPEKVRTEELF